MGFSHLDRLGYLGLHFLFPLCVRHQAILNSDETSHVLQNLDPETEYDVTVTAIYPDESESEDLKGSERTRKQVALCNHQAAPDNTTILHPDMWNTCEMITLLFSQRLFLVLKAANGMWHEKVPFHCSVHDCVKQLCGRWRTGTLPLSYLHVFAFQSLTVRSHCKLPFHSWAQLYCRLPWKKVK